MARNAAGSGRTETYQHPEADLALRPEVGTQPQFRKRKPPVTYRYDSSLSPSLEWDGKNPVREQGEWLIALIDEAAKLPVPQEFAEPRIFRRDDGTVMATCRGLRDAIEQLKRLGKPFLNWSGKAERLSFDVPTLPLFVHGRLSTKAIVETLKDHTKEAHSPQFSILQLFGDPQRPIVDQVLKAYEHGERDKWVNRMILGDSLVVMNSLLHYEGLGGQVQMIYIDPPYGVKFGSNFQPFVRKRDVTHNDDEDMTREPEMVKAYRDTWEMGLHSYLTYLRDRLAIARDLLHPSGSIFVQIGEENLHHVREIADELFGDLNLVTQIVFQKSSGRVSESVDRVYDVLLWYAKDIEQLKLRKLYKERTAGQIDTAYNYIELEDGSFRQLKRSELEGIEQIPANRGRFRPSQLYSQTGGASSRFSFEFDGKIYPPPKTGGWRTSAEGLARLTQANRVMGRGEGLAYKMFTTDFPYIQLHNIWTDVLFTEFGTGKLYAVQTSPTVLRRCLLMTTDPGDLVLDPTCGSGTTAHVAEQWGRRWITIDISRVPLALARQRLLTATYPYYELKDEARGPVGGFVFIRKQNRRGEEIGGIIPHITLRSIANNEPPDEEVLVDRPEANDKITRVAGPFCVEATIPTPVGWDESDTTSGSGSNEAGSFVDRMVEILRRSPVMQSGGGKTVTLRNVRPPAKSLSLSAEAVAENGSEKPVALVFGRRVSLEGHLRRKDPEGRQARRPAGPATDQIRAGDQPEDRQGARPHRAAIAARPRRRGHRMSCSRRVAAGLTQYSCCRKKLLRG
jgi:adenine-specific DNA-methyltransferase